MMLHSMNVNLDKPDTVFETLENIFRPESNQTLSRFNLEASSNVNLKAVMVIWQNCI